ncbi:L-2,4-diaminobutyrate decarboxylase [Klebsiella pneumoniae]|uniref:L-2,4-diaminobutyrate decarboxylase n=1 Tax=Klebsiella pneumoniae TaxID=573 RepID=A0A2X3FZ29_KLEPN|nr:L-2,4-diaminobutyrate decarboxylase [Klebsiella pneumoniae]
MDSWDQSPSATIIEMKLIEWLRARVGFPAGDAGVFTSGGTQSNLMGLMLARDAFFARQGHSIQQDGLPGDIRKYKVLCSENAHFSVQKNMALMGLGYRSVTLVKTDEFARMNVSDLQAKIAQAQANGEQIMAIVATAGTTDAGAIDPLRDIAGIAAEHQIWLHVDAAWGGALLLSEQYRDYLDGLELVDSVTLDFHKQFFPDHQLRRLPAEGRAPLRADALSGGLSELRSSMKNTAYRTWCLSRCRPPVASMR